MRPTSRSSAEHDHLRTRASQRAGTPGGVFVNDVHAARSKTRVRGVVEIRDEAQVVHVLEDARARGVAVSASGGRHAMGGQPFGRDAVLLDLRGLADIRGLDRGRGLVTVGAGCEWPALLRYLRDAQVGDPAPWGIRQKQTGADRLTIGGALAANAHGRGLRYGPMVDDVESFVLVDAAGARRTCSRRSDRERFALAIGGYGLFGVVTEVTLRLRPRRRVRRDVELLDVEALPAAFEQRVGQGYEYGDFQFAIDPASDGFLRRGVFACYRPVGDDVPITRSGRALSPDDFRELLYLAHVDKAAGFTRYAEHYLATSGQVYDTDSHQLAAYPDHYHAEIDARTGRPRGTEMITELYVPRDRLPDFLRTTAEDFRAHRTEVIYGTVRLIERDTTTFLPWARDRYACVIFNLHVEHSARGEARSAAAFRRLIDRALERGGSYYLTYHRHATREQVLAAHPRFLDFLREKRRLDPEERFQSEWYRHYRRMFAADR